MTIGSGADPRAGKLASVNHVPCAYTMIMMVMEILQNQASLNRAITFFLVPSHQEQHRWASNFGITLTVSKTRIILQPRWLGASWNAVRITLQVIKARKDRLFWPLTWFRSPGPFNPHLRLSGEGVMNPTCDPFSDWAITVSGELLLQQEYPNPSIQS